MAVDEEEAAIVSSVIHRHHEGRGESALEGPASRDMGARLNCYRLRGVAGRGPQVTAVYIPMNRHWWTRPRDDPGSRDRLWKAFVCRLR